MKKKLLILIVAFNHEKFIHKVLDRINENLTNTYDVEILINDDSSSDKTVKVAKEYIENSNKKFKYTILSNPINQGYGGNQKIGFLYAIKNNFDYAVMVHGDGQYHPKYILSIIKKLEQNDSAAVCGSRMINKKNALKGNMPFYKFVGNIFLTKLFNVIYSTNFTDCHTGYWIYNFKYIKKNTLLSLTNTFNFDNQMRINRYLTLKNTKSVEMKKE